MSSYSPPSSPSYLYPIVCDLSDVEYANHSKQQQNASCSFSSQSAGENNAPQPCCSCPESAPPSLDFSFADLAIPLNDLIGSNSHSALQIEDSAPLVSPEPHHNLEKELSSSSTKHKGALRADATANSHVLDNHQLTFGIPTSLDITSDTALNDSPPNLLDTSQDTSSNNSLAKTKAFEPTLLTSESMDSGNSIRSNNNINNPPFPRRLTSWRRGFWKRGANAKQVGILNRAGSGMDGSSSTTKAEDEAPAHFDEAYILTRQILQGFQYALWECVHRLTGEVHLVKIFSWSTEDPTFYDEDTGITESHWAQKEVEVLQRIADSEEGCQYNVMKLVQVFYGEESIHVVMENPGDNVRTLQHFVLREGCLPETTVRKLLVDVLDSLHFLNANLGICHNQVQPLHILVTGSNEAFVADFGTASMGNNIPGAELPMARHRSLDTYLHSKKEEGNHSSPKYAGSIIRSASLAPELMHTQQNQHDELLGQSEIPTYSEEGGDGTCACVWSLGVLMHYCLLGHVPPFLDIHQRPRTGHHHAQQHLSDSVLYIGVTELSALPVSTTNPAVKRFSSSIASSPLSSDNAISSSTYQHNNQVRDQSREAGWWYTTQIPISRQAKQFMSACLHQDATIRLTVQEALDHPWIFKIREPLSSPNRDSSSKRSSNRPPRNSSSGPPVRSARRQWWNSAPSRREAGGPKKQRWFASKRNERLGDE